MRIHQHGPWIGLLAAALIAQPTVSNSSSTEPTYGGRVIYGADDRTDIVDLTDSRLLELSRSTAAMVWRTDLKDLGNGMSQIKNSDFGSTYGLCSDERFYSQPVAADCTAFLVGPDIVATAGHCVPSAARCPQIAYAFSYEIDTPDRDPALVSNKDIYMCSEVIGTTVVKGGGDWALIRLDRTVQRRVPLRIRDAGEVSNGDEVFVIGHPAGLPKKVAGGARVRKTTEKSYFSAELDTYGGNSGSPVFNAKTLEVEGILVRGEADFAHDGKCVRSKVCASGTCMGEEVTRIREILPYYPQ